VTHRGQSRHFQRQNPARRRQTRPNYRRFRSTAGRLFRRIKGSTRGTPEPLIGSALYTCVLKKHTRMTGIDADGVCVHPLRVTAATNALENKTDIAKVQEWLGYSSISTRGFTTNARAGRRIRRRSR
jgi:hypothetical protein